MKHALLPFLVILFMIIAGCVDSPTDTGNNGNETVAHTVSFNSNGGSIVSSQQVNTGGHVTQPTPPVRVGYLFDGWYLDQQLTMSWNFQTDVVSGAMTLYAKWIEDEPDVFTVTFNSNSGSTVSSQQITTGGLVTEPSDPTRSGFIFNGWYSDLELDSLWDFSTDTVNDNMTLYAKWTVLEEDNVILNLTNIGTLEAGTINPLEGSIEANVEIESIVFTITDDEGNAVPTSLIRIERTTLPTGEMSIDFSDMNVSLVIADSAYNDSDYVVTISATAGSSEASILDTFSITGGRDELTAINDTIPPVIFLFYENHLGQRVLGGEEVDININDVNMLNKLENTLFEARARGGEGIDISSNVRVDATNVNILQVGTYTITYTVETKPGLADTVTRTVNVISIVEDQPPILTLNEGATLYFRQGNYHDPGAVAYDPNNAHAIISDRITTTDSPVPINNQTVPGTYTRTYSVTNDAGLTTTRDRTFVIQPPDTGGDNTPPEITLHGDNPLTIMQGQAYVEPGYTAIDDVDGDITDRVQVHNPVNINVPMNYTVEYTVSDMAGNPAAAYRTVTVEESTGPLPENFITLNGDTVRYVTRGQEYVEVDPPWILPDPYVDYFLNPADPNGVMVTRTGWPVPTDQPVGYEHTITYTAVHVNSSATEVVTRTVIVQ